MNKSTLIFRRETMAIAKERRLKLGIRCIFLTFLFLLSLPAYCDAFQLADRHAQVYPHSSDRRISSISLQSNFAFVQKRTFITSALLLQNWGGDTNADTSRSTCCLSSSVYSRRRVVLEMVKGDGKKARKKKSATSAAAPSPAPPPQPAALRVSTNINIPVRQQIRYGQMHKALAKQSTTGFRQPKTVKTSYRRAWDEAEIEEKAEERKRKGQDPDWDVILNRTASSPLVIVDGYNIIYKWSRLKKHMAKGDPQRARQLLIDDLESLRSLKGWRIECVFDGMRRSTVGPLGQGPGSSSPTRLDRATKSSVSKHGVREVFTGVGVEADTYIEARCARAKNVTEGEFTGSFIVATDDAMIRMAGMSAGALCMSADRFVDELKAVKKAVDYRVEAAVAKVNGHGIRPEKLRGTHFHRFGRGSVLIEDKRNRTKSSRKKEEVEEYAVNLDDMELEEDENGIPWWAKMPNQTKPTV
jgi:predicted RNA-binding protein with PIN domain